MYIAEHNIACHSDGYSVYFDEAYMESNPDVEVAIPVDELGESRGSLSTKNIRRSSWRRRCAFPARLTAGMMRRAKKLARWMEENGYAFAGNLRGHVIVSPDEQPDPEHWLTQLEVPVRKI
jgi:effector-binding domain-containing protein